MIAATPLLAAVAWVVALIVDGRPFDTAAVLLIGVGILTMATVSVVGMVVAGGRWARRMAMLTVASTLIVALLRPVDILWIAALALSAFAVASLFLPSVTSTIRKFPAATGPPSRAVVVPLVLVTAPFVIGIFVVDATPWAAVVVGLTAPLAGLAYARVLPGGLLGVRILWPALAIGLGPLMGWAGGVVSAGLGVAIASLAWHPSVKTAFHPPREVGSTFPVPPELAPPDILDAARLNDRGRPK